MPGVTATRNGGVEIWSLDFPPVNAIDPAFVSAMESQLASLHANQEISVVLVTSALRVFSAGADAKWMASIIDTEGVEMLVERFKVVMDRFRAINLQLRRSPVLFIALINGHALAGGLEFAAACDLRFASDNDRIQIGVPEMRLFGVMPSGGAGTQFLTRLMGSSRCLEFIMRGEPCNPREALQLGLIDRLMPPDQLLGEAMSFATATAARAGRIGTNAAKRLILDSASMPFEEAMGVDATVHWDTMRRGGFAAGAREFVDRFGRST